MHFILIFFRSSSGTSLICDQYFGCLLTLALACQYLLSIFQSTSPAMLFAFCFELRNSVDAEPSLNYLQINITTITGILFVLIDSAAAGFRSRTTEATTQESFRNDSFPCPTQNASHFQLILIMNLKS
jgi:hypothetical protein